MKIFFLVLMAVFLTSDIIVAAPANGEGKGEAEAPAAVEGEAEDPAVDEEGEAEEQVDVEGEAEDPAVDEEGEAEDQVDEEGEAEDQVDEEGEADEDADDGEDEEDDDVDDKGRENETGKSQLDMILELRHQVKEEQRRNNVQQDQIVEQQRQNDELQRQLKEITKINRAHRGAENDIVEDLKELIRAEINGLSQCVVGNYTTKIGASKPDQDGFKDKKAVSFGRTFPRTPKVVASVAGFERVQQGTGDPTWGLKTEARSPTTSQFKLYVQGYDTKVNRLDVSWIACVWILFATMLQAQFQRGFFLAKFLDLGSENNVRIFQMETVNEE